VKKKMIKLLSPITSFEAAVKVISAGADEIYCGVRVPDIRYEGLATRPFWCNLTTYKELKRVVRYAHDHDVNTIVTTEFPFMTEALEKKIERHVRFYIESGVDAIIASDIGILLMMKELGFDIPIYASTYLASMNYEAVDFLRELGVKRVILERHLAIDEIREIVQRNKSVETEVFVHGPGCSNINVSCYGCGNLFKVLKGELLDVRSLRIISLCRDTYEIYDVGGDEQKKITNAPILDAYSWCSLCRLPDLIKTGVTGFKIVGRCLNPDFQEGVTKVYRELLDLIESGQVKLFKERLRPIRGGKEVLPGGVLPREFCERKRCYYSHFFHSPYKVPVS